MTNKRNHPESENVQNALYHKRSRPNNLEGSDDLPTSSQPRIDPTYGQRGAFPGLDASQDDDLFYGPASDGLEYLRMVRSEAKTVPNVLVAPVSPTVRPQLNDLYADYPQGYYSNGAYTATPLPFPNPRQADTNGGQQEDQDPQEAYYASLCARFKELTELLQSPPPRAAPDNTDMYYLDWRKTQLWRKNILKTAPTMVLVAQLTQESVICGLEVLESLLTSTNLKGKHGRNIGAWSWSLLGRCREVGEMSSEDVGVLRKLGKQAVWLLRKIRTGEIISEAADEPVVDEGEKDEEEGYLDEEGERDEGRVEEGAGFLDVGDADDVYPPHIDPITTSTTAHNDNSSAHPILSTSDADLAKAKQHILASLATDKPQIEDSPQTPTQTPTVMMSEANGAESLTEGADETAMLHATLDMLVTIIGEFYGQKDLLTRRLLWGEMQ